VVLAIAALAVLGLALVLRSDWAGEKICAEVRLRAPQVMGMPVRIDRCVIDPLTASVEIQGVSAGPEARPILKADLASVSLAGLFPSGISLQNVTILRPSVDIEIPELSETAPADCPLEVLARVQIGRLEIQDATVTLRLPGGRDVHLDGLDLHAQVGRRTSEVEVSLRHGSVTLDATRTLAIGRVAVEATLDAKEQVLEIQNAELSAEGISLSGSGEFRELCKPAPEIEANGQVYLPIESLTRLGVELPSPSGQIWTRVSVAGPLTAPSVRAELRASQIVLGPFSPGDFSARISFSDGVVHLDDFSSTAGDGEIHLSGELTLSEGLPLRARIVTKDASLAKVLERASVTGAWVDFPVSVKAEVTGHLLPTPELSGPVDFTSGPFLLAARAYDAPKAAGTDILAFSGSRGTFTFGFTPKAVTFDDISLGVGARGHTQIGGRVRLGITGKGPPDLDIDAVASTVDLSDFGSISGLPWSGTGSATARVTGPAGRAVITGQASLRDFKLAGYSLGVVQSPVHYEGDTLSFEGLVAQKGRTQLFGDIKLDFFDSGLHTRASVQLPDGRVEDIVDLLVDLSPEIQNLQEVLVGRVSMVAAFDSPAGQLSGLLAVRVSDVAYLERRFGAANVVLRFEEGQRLVLDPTTFEGAMGRVTADGSWDFDGPLDCRIAWDEGSLAQFVDPVGAKALGLTGALTGRLVVGGTVDVYEMKGALSSSDVKWKTQSLGPMNLALTLFGRDLTVTGQVIEGVTGRLGLKMRNEWPYDSSFDIDLPNLSAFLPASTKGLQVGLAGALTAVGPIRDLSRSRAVAYLEKLVVSRGDVSASNVGPAELAWNAGSLQIKSLAMKGATTDVSAEGSWGPARVNLRTQGALDLRLLSTFVPDLRLLSTFVPDVERASGRLDFTAAFGGPVSAPSVIGSADLVDARLTVKGQDLSVRSLSGHAEFSESRVVIQDVAGFLNDGRLNVRGEVGLDKLSLGTLNLEIKLEDVNVPVHPKVPATISGKLFLRLDDGPSSLYKLSGEIDVGKFWYTEPLSLETLLETARKRTVPSDDQPTEWLRFNVDGVCGDDVRVENNLARARFVGKLKLAGTNVKPILVGSIEAAQGAQAYFRNNVFTVGRAVLQFNGLWPTFDFSAQTVVREFLVNVKAFGRFEEPRISFTAEPALSEADVVSLLTLGVTTREQLAGQAGLGLAAEALLSTTGLDRQVQRFLSQNVGLKDQQVRLTTTFNQATGTAEPSVTWESKVGLDNLKVGVTQPVTGKGTSAQAEYRFNQSVSGRLQWDNQNLNTTVGNPGADLRFRFEWE
jgi:translocation and assembly module TamB